MHYPVVTACPQCGAQNRIPAKHLADRGKCGACKSALNPVGEPVEVDASAFEEIVREARVPVLVDFWAAWCGPCRMAAPEIEALAREMAGQALVLKVDTEREPALSARYRVASIPNFLVFRNGRPVFQQPGLVGRAQMRSWLESAAAQAG
ncbi:MAG TPA: thioredoxin TrxC [Bryobacteraceae bacterium]|nr:thioredoxin TrxC [Bryobacteraceae bacterium]